MMLLLLLLLLLLFFQSNLNKSKANLTKPKANSNKLCNSYIIQAIQATIGSECPSDNFLYKLLLVLNVFVACIKQLFKQATNGSECHLCIAFKQYVNSSKYPLHLACEQLQISFAPCM